MKASEVIEIAWSERIKEWNKNPSNLWFMAEVHELWEEIRKGNIDGIREEYHDVCHHFSVWLLSLEIDLTLYPWFGLPSYQKTLVRIGIWELIFKKHGVDWDRNYLDGGSNPERMDKVEAKLIAAGVDASKIDWPYIQEVTSHL